MRKLLFPLALLLTMCLASLPFLPGCSKEAPAAPPAPEPKAHPSTAVQAVEPPTVLFRDWTKQAGIDFVHVHGGFGKKLLPETMGPGVLVFDFNRDGRQDIFLVNSCRWSHHQYDSTAPPARSALLLNDGKEGEIHFTDVTEQMGLGDFVCYGMGAVAGDIDNDGFPELFVTALGRAYLFHNEQGKRFRDITEEAGVKCPGWSTAAAFLDYDRDGRLDLFVAHYVKWTPETDLFCTLDGKTKSYCQPMLYEGEHCQLFRNVDGKRFEDVSEKAGVQVMGVTVEDEKVHRPASKALGVAVHDYNDDGWPDLAVANDTTPNFLFHNNGDGTFTNVAARKGVELINARGSARGAMGIHWGYYRDGETLGLAVANFSNEPNGLLRYSTKSDTFHDAATFEGIDGPSRLPLKFGLFFFDYDQDGRLDLFTSNGHIEPEIESIQAAVKYAQPGQLFWNAGPAKGPCFREVEAKHAGPDLFQPRVGRGCAYGDFDNDGDLDIILNNNHQPAVLLRNETRSAKAIRLRFIGGQANRDGYGCRVKLTAAGKTQQAELSSGGSYLSQNESVLTFGLGDKERAERVEIRWPAPKPHTTTLENLAAGFTYVVDEEKRVVEQIPFGKRSGE